MTKSGYIKNFNPIINILIVMATVSIFALVRQCKSHKEIKTAPPIVNEQNPDQGIIKILILGDSLSAGYGMDPTHAFPSLLQSLLNEKYPQYQTEVITDAISGSTSSSMMSRLQNHLDQKINIIMIAMGSNDGLRGLSIPAMEQNLKSVIDVAQKNNMKIILSGMKIPINYGLKYRNDFQNTFKKLAKEYKLTFIPFLLKGVALNSEFNLPDGIHPNEKGHKVIVQTILPYFEKLYN